jgi:formylglycine-generating enzyme required for sulfatase activity
MISPFDLDKYEVTVGRMRAFVAAGGVTQLAPPATGAGALPKVAGSGWNPGWNTLLPADLPGLRASLAHSNATWTDQPGANENLPINNVSWFVALAFCAWDGGRLPTYAEMNFAAAGGSDQRAYPWSVPANTQTITRMQAAYDCNFTAPSQNCPASSCSDATSSPCDPTTCIAPATCQYPACTGCTFTDIAMVGSLPAGKGKWGHFDLAGNVAELVYDTDAPLPLPCVDCVHAPPTMFSGPPKSQKLNASFLVTGGGWDNAPTSLLTTSFTTVRDDAFGDNVGFRCAR